VASSFDVRTWNYAHDCNGIVVEDSRNIFRWELVGRIADEKTGLADRTIPHNDASDRAYVSFLIRECA
jgi:hypothetical protein